MRLEELFGGYAFEGDGKIDVTDIVCDSRKITKGCAFVCIEGFAFDGHSFAKAASEQGASVIIAQKKVEADCPVVLVENTRRALAVLCSGYHDNPSKKFKLIGITGTNGKTTTTFLIKHILDSIDLKTGLIGTNRNMIGDEILETARTTPDAFELQGLFARMAEAKVDAVIMEVSSHALSLDRVYGCDFDIGVFTNITQDHLDFHKTMEEYLKAKQILLGMCKQGIVNLDDAHGQTVKDEGTCPILTFGIDSSADLMAENVKLEQNMVSFTLGETEYQLGIPGKFSVYNALCAVAVCKTMGVSEEDISKHLKTAQGVRGRAQVVKVSDDFTVLIDYAHTPDGIENILKTARGFAKGRVVILFGCGGDRDNSKRPIMGEMASRLADFCIVTSDNPRTENPSEIIKQILSGIKKDNYIVIENRLEAIEYAIANAKKDDVIILAGKGHETYQTIGTENIHFDEQEILEKLADRRKEVL